MSAKVILFVIENMDSLGLVVAIARARSLSTRTIYIKMTTIAFSYENNMKYEIISKYFS